MSNSLRRYAVLGSCVALAFAGGCQTADRENSGRITTFEARTMNLSNAEWESSAPPTVKLPNFSRTANELVIELPDADRVGFWTTMVKLDPAPAWRITATADVSLPPGNDAGIIVSFLDRQQEPLERNYLDFSDAAPRERKFDMLLPTPAGTEYVQLSCFFKWQAGTARFRDLVLTAAPLPPPRPVRIATTRLQPPWPSTVGHNLQLMEDTLERIGRENDRLDLIVLPECITDRNTETTLIENSEAIPGGPTFELLSRMARKFRTYIAISIHELDEGKFYNTAFLVDREGKLVGKYRKVHLSMREMEVGIVPGNSFPTFQLDFGRVGLLICWDNWFGESARALRLGGAELLIFPIAGDGQERHWQTVWPARAIDNGIPLIVSITNENNPAAIIDRDGVFLSAATDNGAYAFAEIDLNERKKCYWLSVGPSLGDPYQLYIQERRPVSYPAR